MEIQAFSAAQGYLNKTDSEKSNNKETSGFIYASSEKPEEPKIDQFKLTA